MSRRAKWNHEMELRLINAEGDAVDVRRSDELSLNDQRAELEFLAERALSAKKCSAWAIEKVSRFRWPDGSDVAGVTDEYALVASGGSRHALDQWAGVDSMDAGVRP